jgi:hypothetical protein
MKLKLKEINKISHGYMANHVAWINYNEYIT